MRIICEINDETIRKASAIVMKHYKDDDFLEKLIEVDSFNHTHQSPIMVSFQLGNMPRSMTFTIKEYKSLNPFSKAIGYAKDGIIYFNSRKSGTILDRVETIYHEITHLCGYSHNGNRVNSYNLLSVPYLASNIFKNYVKDFI